MLGCLQRRNQQTKFHTATMCTVMPPPCSTLFSCTAQSNLRILCRFVLCWNIVVCLIGLGALMAGKLPTLRKSLTGLFIVGTFLFIQASDAFLGASEIDNVTFQAESGRDRIRATVGAFIMTAAIDAALVLGLGLA